MNIHGYITYRLVDIISFRFFSGGCPISMLQICNFCPYSTYGGHILSTTGYHILCVIVHYMVCYLSPVFTYCLSLCLAPFLTKYRVISGFVGCRRGKWTNISVHITGLYQWQTENKWVFSILVDTSHIRHMVLLKGANILPISLVLPPRQVNISSVTASINIEMVMEWDNGW